MNEEEKIKHNLGRNLRYLRLSKKPTMPQHVLAKKLQIAQSSISHYEKGHHLPPVHILTQIADYFGYSVDELLGDALPDRKGCETL